MTEVLRFDEKTHRYTLSGKPLAGVTTIISNIPEELALSSAFMRKAALGTEVHAICERINRGMKVSFKGVDPEIKLYVDGWKKFLVDFEVKPLLCECCVYHDLYGYAGTLDLFAFVGGHPVILDIKTVSCMSRTPALQTAAYNEALHHLWKKKKIDTVKPTGDRMVVQLLPDGGYKLYYYSRFTQSFHFEVFKSKLLCLNWDSGLYVNGMEELPRKYKRKK